MAGASRFLGGSLNMRVRLARAMQGNESVVARRAFSRARLACGAMCRGVGRVMLTACGETITKHGHHFQDNDLQQVSSGMSQDQVRSTLGTPTTTATVGSGTAFYYISSTTGQTSFFKPVEKDRKVLAVYFSPLGSVDRVAQYGLKDGKVFDYVKQRNAFAGEGRRHPEGPVPQSRHQAARPRVDPSGCPTWQARGGRAPSPRGLACTLSAPARPAAAARRCW